VKCSKNKYGLYIHVPFCLSKCPYCHFYSVSIDKKEEFFDIYLRALQEEVARYKSLDFKYETLYVGGGTPNVLSPKELATLLELVHKNLDLGEVKEKSIEVNPENVKKDFIKVIKEFGFNRVSIGAQSFIDKELKLLGRQHTVKDTIRTFQILREAGFNNINIDLIFAFKGQTLPSFQYSLEQTCDLAPEHISTYTMTYEKPARKDLELKDEETVVKMFRLRNKILKAHGFKMYEISNYSKKGFECLHNLKYWLRHYYIGLGPSASGFYLKDGKEIRYTNPSSFLQYSKGIKKIEILNENQKVIEEIFLSLRTKWGLKVKSELLKSIPEELKPFIKVKNNSLFLTEKGMLVADSIALKIYEHYEELKKETGL